MKLERSVFFRRFLRSTFSLIIITIIGGSEGVNAAPHPGATASLAAPRMGIFRSPAGFQVSSGDSGWLQTAAPPDNRYIATIYKSPTKNAKGENPMLTVRIDSIAKNTTIDRYIQRWTKEYPKFGFDVLGSRPFAQSKDKGYVLDLINRDSGRQLRQAVFLKKQKVVILTCRDQSDSFKDSLKSCNQIIRTFQWGEAGSTPSSTAPALSSSSNSITEKPLKKSADFLSK